MLVIKIILYKRIKRLKHTRVHSMLFRAPCAPPLSAPGVENNGLTCWCNLGFVLSVRLWLLKCSAKRPPSQLPSARRALGDGESCLYRTASRVLCRTRGRTDPVHRRALGSCAPRYRGTELLLGANELPWRIVLEEKSHMLATITL